MVDQSVALITGASKGIGLALAQHFLALGYRVAGCSRGDSTLDASDYNHTRVDVAIEKEVVNWVREIRRSWKRIDVLVCNAAYAPASQLLAMTQSEMWNRVMRTNVDGTFFACREVAKLMMAQRSGRIVTVSSMAAALHLEGTGAYAASKAAIVEMTKVLARELASSGATCNVVAVSMVKTDAVEALGETVIGRALDRLTLKRVLDVDEICNAVGFFCAPMSRSITGQVIQLGLVT
jgi:3-oxoacyl-[acyl-carrier protein] reductase